MLAHDTIHTMVDALEGQIDVSRRPAPVSKARTLAFYLPQFHPVKENDEWWGRGFTEWTNTAKARPLYPRHKQPHLPADLGFYDLRMPESRVAQADLARANGVEGFLYWHYWFGNGRRLLERPFAEVLASGQPDFGFALAWANQTWTGIWHGASDKTLMEQLYPGAEDDQAHFDLVIEAFRDPRYIRVDGKPLFYVFRPEQLPDAAAWTERWQRMARAAGLPGLYLVAEVSDLLGGGPKYSKIAADGFDAGVYVRLPADVNRLSQMKMRVGRKLRLPERWPHIAELPQPPTAIAGDRIHPCVYPNWDNTPRSGRRGLVIEGSTPNAFRQHVRDAVSRLDHRDPEHRLLFVKSWNEWAEGNYLEPDTVTGLRYLDALAAELGVG